MSTKTMYGVDTSQGGSEFSGLNFGLNQNVTLKEFKFNPNGGKDGAVQDALDIVFDVDGKEVSYRQFPIVKVFDNNAEITDSAHPKFVEAVKDFNRRMTQLVLCFTTEEELNKLFEANEPSSFKGYVETLVEAIGEDKEDTKLDLFAQYQWQIGAGRTQTYLELPKNLKQGSFVCKHVEPVGEWKLSETSSGIKYVDEADNVHPFTRTKWFKGSQFAKHQSINREETNEDYEF